MKALAEHYLVHETLKSGRAITIRAIEPTDKPLLREGMHHLSPQSLYYRFFTAKRELTDDELVYFTELDFVRHVGLVALLEEDGQLHPAGVARYIISDKQVSTLTAEIAFAVEEEYQGLGIGSLLLKHLTEIARREGLRFFNCYVMISNVKMLTMLSKSKLPMKKALSYEGVYEINLKLT